MTPPDKAIEKKDTSPAVADIDPIETPVEEKSDASTHDNADKISKIEANITEIKTSVSTLKTEVEELDKSKATLSKEVLTTKEQEIETKKLVIEAKKKETQELINAIRQGRIELKLETLEADVKAVAEAQKVKEETLLTAYEADLKEIEVTKKTFWEKIKDGTSKSWERIKEHKKPILIATGVGLLIGWMAGWFKKKKKSGENDKDGEEKKEGFWNHGVGKFLKYAGIGVAGFFGIKALLNRLKPETTKPPEEQKSDFDKLSEAEKKKYNDFADKVNTMNETLFKTNKDHGWKNNVNLGIGYDGKEEKDYRGVVPFSIDKSYANVESIISEKGIYEAIIGKNIQEYETYLLNWPKEKLSNLLLLFLTRVGTFSIAGYKPGADIAECIKNWLAVDKDANKKLDFFFEQYIEVANYLEEKKTELKEKIALKKLKTELPDNKKRDDLTADEQDDVLQAALDNSTWMEINVDPTLKTIFEEKKISELSESLSEFDLDDGKISADLQKDIASVDEDRDDILDYDKDTKVDILDRALTDIADGKLDDSTRKDLVMCTEKLSEDAVNLNGSGFMQKYFEPIAIILNMDSVTKEEYLKNGTGKAFLEGFSKTLLEYKTKFESGTVTTEDIENFKALSEEYFAFKKKTIIAIHAMTGINSDDPDKRLRPLNAYCVIMTSFWDALHEKMGFMERGAKLTYGFVVAGGTLYLVGAVSGLTPVFKLGKNMVKIGAFVPKTGMSLAMRMAKCSIMDKVPLPGWYRKNAIINSSDPKQLLKNAIMTGKINEGRAVRITRDKNFKGTSVNSMEEVLTEYCGVTDKTEAKMIKNYLKDANVRKIMIKETPRPTFGSKVDRIKYNIRERQIGFDYEFRNIAKLKVIDALVSDSGGNILKGALKGVSVKDFDLLYNMANKPDAVKSLTAWFNINTGIATPETFGKFLGKNLAQFTDVADFESFLKQVPLSEITDEKTLKIVITNWRDVKIKLAKGDKLADIIPTLPKKYTKTPKTPIAPKVGQELAEAQTTLEKSLNEKIKNLETKRKAGTPTEKVSIRRQMDKLEAVVKDIKAVPEDELKALNKLFDIGVDMKYTSKILAADDVAVLLTKIDAAKDADDLKLAFKAHGLESLTEELKLAKKLTVLDDMLDEFKPLIKGLRLIPLMEEGKDIAKIVKIISKVDKFL